MLWDNETISPADWLGILEFELRELKIKPVSPAILKWLLDRGLKLESADGKPVSSSTYKNHISRMHRNSVSTKENRSYYQQNMARVIMANVSFRSCVCYFEDLAYRSIKFFIPRGDIDHTKGTHPIGAYQATRYSIAESGKIIRSAFLFYENSVQSERLQPYEHYKSSRVLRFKELRRVQRAIGTDYTIYSGGMVFWDRQCFIAIGASYESTSNKPESELQFSDIRNARTVYYILDDDGDADVVRGVKASVLRSEGDPVAPTIELRRVSGLEGKNWQTVLNSNMLEIGIFDPKAPENAHLREFEDRLRPHPSSEFLMPRVKPYTQ